MAITDDLDQEAINVWTRRQRVVSVGLTPIAPRRMLSRNR